MSKILTRRNFLKAGLIGATLLVGGKLTYDCYSRQSNTSNSGLVRKLELPAGFEAVGKIESSPIALAGHTKDLASFLLREEGEKPFMRKKNPDTLGVYVLDNSGIKRVGDFPVFPDDLVAQGISAIGQGDNRYDCFIDNSDNVEVRRTDLTNGLSYPLYKGRGISTKMEEAVRVADRDLILLRDDGRGEFLFVDSQKAPANYSSVQKLKLPHGEEWEKLEEYMKTNSPKGYEMLVNDYLERESTRAKVQTELTQAGETKYPIIVLPYGIAGDHLSVFGTVQYSDKDCRLVRKKLENKGSKK